MRGGIESSHKENCNPIQWIEASGQKSYVAENTWGMSPSSAVSSEQRLCSLPLPLPFCSTISSSLSFQPPLPNKEPTLSSPLSPIQQLWEGGPILLLDQRFSNGNACKSHLCIITPVWLLWAMRKRGLCRFNQQRLFPRKECVFSSLPATFSHVVTHTQSAPC